MIDGENNSSMCRSSGYVFAALQCIIKAANGRRPTDSRCRGDSKLNE